MIFVAFVPSFQIPLNPKQSSKAKAPTCIPSFSGSFCETPKFLELLTMYLDIFLFLVHQTKINIKNCP
jgi:hypothetical protein